MPFYTYKCNTCNSVAEDGPFRVDDRHKMAPKCCGAQMSIKITAPMCVTVDNLEAYKCPVTQKTVTSTRQKKNIEAENNLVVVEPGMDWKTKKIKKFRETPVGPEAIQNEMKQMDKYMADA